MVQYGEHMAKKAAKTKSSKPPVRRVPSRRRKLLTEIVGWYGALAVLVAYCLASFNLTGVHDAPYLVLNFTGALGILTVATAKHVRQSMVVNAFWAAMAGLALVKIVFQV